MIKSNHNNTYYLDNKYQHGVDYVVLGDIYAIQRTPNDEATLPIPHIEQIPCILSVPVYNSQYLNGYYLASTDCYHYFSTFNATNIVRELNLYNISRPNNSTFWICEYKHSHNVPHDVPVAKRQQNFHRFYSTFVDNCTISEPTMIWYNFYDTFEFKNSISITLSILFKNADDAKLVLEQLSNTDSITINNNMLTCIVSGMSGDIPEVINEIYTICKLMSIEFSYGIDVHGSYGDEPYTFSLAGANFGEALQKVFSLEYCNT